MRSTLLLASFLAVVPITTANPTRPQAARQAIPTPTIIQNVDVDNPAGGTYIFRGCFTDSETKRTVAHEVTPSGIINVPNCVEACGAQSFLYAGIENGGRSCYCGNAFGGSSVDQSKCQVACLDDPSQACGDFNIELVYALG